MNGTAYAFVVLCGAFALALWVDLRFPQLTPRSWTAAMLHLGGSILVFRLVLPAGLALGRASPGAMLIAVLTLVIPALLYSMIAAMWIIKVAHGAMSSSSRQ